MPPESWLLLRSTSVAYIPRVVSIVLRQDTIPNAAMSEMPHRRYIATTNSDSDDDKQQQW